MEHMKWDPHWRMKKSNRNISHCKYDDSTNEYSKIFASYSKLAEYMKILHFIHDIE